MTSSQLNKLQAQNQVLSEELTQCQADKEFVWSLWKRLQVANPDVTQAISLVVQREKEKAELKDRKILEILQIKDDRIAELERLLSQKQDELKGFLSRKVEMHDENKGLRKENKHLREQQQQLEQLLQSKEVRMKNIEDINKETMEKTENDKQECEKLNASLTLELDMAKKEVDRFQAVNLEYKSRIKDLEKDIKSITETAEKAVHEEDGNLKKLKDSTDTLRGIKAELTKKCKELVEQQKDVTKLRSELCDLQTAYGQAIEHTSHQADVIQQLQSLQLDTQKVLKNQEDAHKIETSSFQSMYQELQSRYKATKSSEQQLRQQLIEAKEQLSQRKATKNAGTQVNLMVGRRPFSNRDEDIDGTIERGRYTRDDLDERYRPVSLISLRGQIRRSRSLSPQRPHSLDGSTTKRDQVEIAAANSDMRDADVNARKVADLRKLLKLKNAELDEMKSSHSRRLERLRALQASYNVLKEQVKTYDAQERNLTKKKKSRRSEPRTLQKEDSDAVWNELAYFKQQTVNVLQERMNLHEELDCLRVQTMSDATTIKELTKCLEQERQELEEQLSQLKEVSRREKLEKDQALELQDKINNLERSVQKLEMEKGILSREKSHLEKDNRSLRKDVSKQRAVEAQKESKMMELKKTISQLKKKLRQLKQRQRHTVGALSWRRNKTPKEHQTLLNQSIKEMSSIFPGFDSDGWEEMQSDSPRESTSIESLGRQIVDTSHTDEMFHTPRRGTKSRGLGPLSPSARQLASVQKHLQRMALAYVEKPVRDVILKSVATQTGRVLQASMTDASVGEYLISDDVVSTITSSTMTDDTRIETSDTEHRDVGTSPHVLLAKLARNINQRSTGTSGPSLASLKQRIASLQQQVSLLKESKIYLQNTVTEQEELTDQLQCDLSLANQRLKISKQTVQRLSGELEQSNQLRALSEKQLLEGESESKKHSDSERKQLEARVKAQSSEVARQANVIKYLKSDIKARDETIKILKEKVSRQERDINQKRSLLEDMKVRARAVDTDNKVATRATELLEEKISNLTEANNKKKTEVDSIRKQLSTITKEKRHYEQLYMKIKTELDRKGKLLQEANINLAEAENISTELEITAGQQMKQLASQTEIALGAAHGKLKCVQAHNTELQAFIKALASILISQTKDVRLQLNQCHKLSNHGKDVLNGSLSRAQGIASSILNISASDLDEFMASSEEDTEIEVKEEKAERKKDELWSKQLESALSSKVPSSDRLLDLFLGKLQERDQLLGSMDHTRR